MSIDNTKAVHLLCLIHGMWGNPKHLSEAARIITENAQERKQINTGNNIELDVLIAQTNRDSSTYDGIDWGGERIADEIYKRIEEIEKDDGKKVVKFSVLGYSLGGLLARYVVGILQSRGFFTSVQPVNFTTIATPHVGLPRYPGLWSTMTNAIGPRLLSRTGEQFYAVDKWGTTEQSLLEVMADPDKIFLKALKRFERVSLYANAVNDTTVPYVAAAIEAHDPFIGHKTNGLEVEFDTEYNPLLVSYKLPATPPPRSPSPSMFSEAWWEQRRNKPKRSFLPPFLQKPFPINVLIYVALPLLIPTAICLVIFRLSMESRASRARIRLLESESQSSDSRLITMIRSLEKEVDDAVADLMDGDPTSVSEDRASVPTPLGTRGQPKLKPSQLRMVEALNTALGPEKLKKHLAFIDPSRNSHATIVSRDVERFDFHKIGWGVLRHWADEFEL